MTRHPPDHTGRAATEQPLSGSDFLARLREWFGAALDVPADQRDAWITAHVTDPEERAALARLLESDADTSGFFETPASEHAAGLAADAGDDPNSTDGLIGTCVGAFRLVRLLGKGGMAVVFLGEREGGDFRQRVAVKLLRRGLYSELEQRLFRRERQLLAALTHPNIAHMIDGGVTAAGIPFLVMEYVDGLSVTRHAAEHRLGVRERIELFLTICLAVEAAHRRLVVHRDIKPSNILVDAEGSVKLLDFGIAKLVDEEGEAPTAAVFTPEYAAPEQRAGMPVTTATDVYALGLLLHELLLGTRPDTTLARRPSSRVDAATDAAAAPQPVLRRLLRGDLDNILLRALEAEPERRYASAGALADDIRRHLDGRPVDAHPPSHLYQARKFVARHRGGVAIATTLVLAVLAGLALALWQADVARRQAARADAQASRAVAVRDFMVDLFDAAKAKLAADERPTPDVLVHQARERIEADATLPVSVRADVLATLGEVSIANGDHVTALDLLTKASAIKQGLYPADDIERWSTEVQRANALQRLGRGKETASMLEPLLPIFRASDSEEALEGLQMLAVAQMRTGRADAAIATAREVAAKAPRVFAHDTLEELQQRAFPALTLTVAGRHAEAIPELQAVLARWRASSAGKGIEYAQVLNNLAVSKQMLGDFADAETLLAEASDIQRRINPANPTLATSLRNLASARVQIGRYAEAAASLQDALAIDDAAFPAQSLKRTNSLVAQAVLDTQRGRIDDAERHSRGALALCGVPDAATYDACALAHHQLGLLMLRAGRLDEAEAEIGRALEQRRRVFGESHVNVAAELTAAADIALARGDPARSLASSEQALEILARSGAGQGRDALLAGIVHAHALLESGRRAEAHAEAERLLATWNPRVTEPTPQQFDLLGLRALALAAEGDAGAGRAHAQTALALKLPVASLDPRLHARLRALAAAR